MAEVAETETQTSPQAEGGQGQHQHQGGAPKPGKPDGKPAAKPVGPGLAAVEALQGTGEAAAAAVVKEIHAHPDERDDIMQWLQQSRGNAFVQDVTRHMGQVERALPKGVDLKSVRGSVNIPGKRKLSGDWKATVATREPTQVMVEVTHTGVQIHAMPSLFVDATWPLQNASIRGASIQFADGKAHADVEDGHGLGSGMWSIKDNVAEKITGMLEKGIHGSPLAKPGYDPTQDADLGGTLHSVEQGFASLFEGEASDKQGKPPAISDKEMTNVQAGGTVTLKAGGQFMKDGTGLKIDAGSDISLDAIGAGNVHDVASAGADPQAAAASAKISALRIAAGGMVVMSGGKPVAKVTEMTILPGGEVKVDQMELMGKAADAQAGEAGLSLLIGLLALAGHDASAGDALNNAQRPQVVDGVTRKLLEQNFTEQVRKMVLQYRTAVPGMDIAKVLGIG